MKYKEIPPRKNKVLMYIVLPLLVFITFLWLVIGNYKHFIIYLIITLILIHLYFCTYYYLEEKCLIIKAGFIKVKINYKSIIDIVNENDKIIVKQKNINFTLYPENKDTFLKELKKKTKIIERKK